MAENRCMGCVKKLRLDSTLTQMLLAVVIGAVVGLTLRSLRTSDDVTAWIQIFGELLLRMFKVIALPLIISCLVSG